MGNTGLNPIKFTLNGVTFSFYHVRFVCLYKSLRWQSLDKRTQGGMGDVFFFNVNGDIVIDASTNRISSKSTFSYF